MTQPPGGWLRRSSRETDGAVWLALLAGLLLLLPNSPPRPLAVLYALLMTAVLALAIRWRVGLLAIAVLLVAGLSLRVVFFGAAFSDVLRVTIAAIDLVGRGGNPYGVGYEVTTPPGAPFAYGPLTLLWYLPFRGDPRVAEMIAAALILIALAVRGRPLGLALYALTPILITTAGDGSNDTSAGLLLLIALIVASRVPRAGAVLLALAVAFKPYAAAWVPGLWAWAGGGVLLAFLAGFALTWGPAIFIWGPGSILESYLLADRIHRTSYYSLGFLVEASLGRKLEPGLFGVLRLAVGGLLAIFTWRWVRSSGGMVVTGALIYVATLFTGYWSTHAYVAAIAPIICWHVDDWLGLGSQRVALPGDPLGKLQATIDRRWPAITRGSGGQERAVDGSVG
ncbi:MAG: hypothetical protein H0W07_05660 [Chloroflexi bacterium]|nr:hypothetical protein [Chloroflexota bacterium]